MLDIQKQYNIVKNSLKEKRFIHTLGVVSTAKKLAKLNDVSIEIDSLKRSAVIRYEAVTDEKTYKEEVKIGG